jgi:heme-degrading monooxygenase HmoA
VIVVLFEAEPRPGRREDYLALAAELAPALERREGFVSVERFESLTKPGKVLSLSLWRDHAAIRAWRAYPAHAGAQALGRGEIFTDYRLRIAEVVREYGMTDLAGRPPDVRARP